MKNKVYVLAFTYDVPEEEYRAYVNPLHMRRYGRLLRRALVTAVKCMRDSGIQHPDAIINGTCMGSFEETEKLLDGLAEEGESVSMPTRFMLCTHNSVASLIGLYTHNHGYNNTYSQRNVSFESAVLDAFLQLKAGKIRTALVCANDELTPSLRSILERLGISQSLFYDRSIAMMLSVERGEHPLREITGVGIWHEKGKGDKAQIVYKEICD
ncbi:MAG: beta-ketoacyl synthase chain length factor [Prevotella sp.]|nr:beta-ketoacyl synthase chain length factor [Prevotella sp.]